MDNSEYARRIEAIGRAFSPAAPITNSHLFSGRREQLRTLTMVRAQRGQHALIYGERGVGKTSLAQVGRVNLPEDTLGLFYVCNSGDTFASIWTNVLDDVILSRLLERVGFETGRPPKAEPVRAATLLGGEVTPNSVVRALEQIANGSPLVIVIDEFDRPEDESTRTLMADTIKILADRSVAATIVLVGVASSVEQLVKEHESIARSLKQIQMPRMTDSEIRDIVERGMAASELEVDNEFVESVVQLSQGLPHYTHLLCQQAALRAVDDDRTSVTLQDFEAALTDSLEAVSATIRERYHRATFSNRETLYKLVLLACAMAQKDEMGSFGAPDVREQLRKIAGKDYDIPAFSAHLKDFSSDGDRGGILQRIGTSRRFRYRFKDSLMPPYVVIRGRVEKLGAFEDEAQVGE